MGVDSYSQDKEESLGETILHTQDSIATCATSVLLGILVQMSWFDLQGLQSRQDIRNG